MFAVLPGRPRRTLEGVHSTTVPHTALKSILASLSVRNLHRVVCRGSRYSRWQNALSRPFVPSSESGVARYQWRPTKPAYIRFVLSPLPISRPSRDTQPFRAARFSILAVLTPISLSLFRFFFFHSFFSRGEIEVSLSLSFSPVFFISGPLFSGWNALSGPFVDFSRLGWCRRISSFQWKIFGKNYRSV